MGYIRQIEDSKNLNYLEKKPDKCPLCKNLIIPKYILIHEKQYRFHELLCKCPNGECESLFFAVYTMSTIRQPGDTNKFKLSYLYPQSKSYEEFPKEINELSPEFIKIYNQAFNAEQAELNLICGGAYRKSLEFLLKDYIISEHPEDAETVKAIHSIQKCINDYISDSDIQQMAERATWLGNDETHYTRKWEGTDINDLKNLIDLTVYFIAMKIKSQKYRDEMKN
ncbi:DUF4145 domain-containing protein [Salinicoccus carnicancri]|uniref:DUF4145 domain-containing protein n=1 Tax=Salinicoccus carnicancri TaxID=558170 RepID=UPI00037CD1A3|nr:DUF4145 domain-containing protein [Salinicoccus carnicancri]